MLVPILIVVFASLDPAGLPWLIPQNLTSEHYRQILGDPNLLRAAINSLIVRRQHCALCPDQAALAGYAFSRYTFPGKVFSSA